MKRLLIIALTVLMLSMSSYAQEKPSNPTPKVDRGPAHTNPYAVKDPYWTIYRVTTPHFWQLSAAMWASSAAPIIGGNHCRRVNGVEPCTAHYGSYWATVGFGAGLTIFGGTGAYYACRKSSHNSKKCDLIPAAIIGGNVGWGIHEGLIYKHGGS